MSEIINEKKIIEFFSTRENKYIIASNLYPDKKLTYKQLTEFSKVSYEQIVLKVNKFKEWFNIDVDGSSKVISITEKTKSILENQYKEYQKNNELILEQQRLRQLKIDNEENILSCIRQFIELSDSIKLQQEQNSIIVVIDFNDIMLDIDLSNYALDNTDDFIESFKIILKEENNNIIQVSFINLPDSCYVTLNDIRSKNLNKFIKTRCQIKGKSKIKVREYLTTYDCPICGKEHTIKQFDDKHKKPSVCDCGYKGKFKKLDSSFEDYQSISLESLSEDLEFNQQPNMLYAELKAELLNKKKEMSIPAGSRCLINGIVRQRDNDKDNVRDFYIDINSFETLDESLIESNPSKEEMKEIKKIANCNNPVYFLKDKIFNNVYGEDMPKELLILQQFSGFKQIKKYGNKAPRESLHLLFIGDPGTAKTDLIDTMKDYSPRSRRVSGAGSSGVGLTASVIKDEITGDFMAMAGAIPKCHKGTCYVDEFDKMSKNDIAKLHEAIETQKIYVDRAGVSATMYSETKLTATANTKGGCLYPDQDINIQIRNTFPPAIIDRMDFICIFKDLSDNEKDKRISDKMAFRIIEEKESISKDLMKKYIVYANTFNPVITREFADIISNFYKEIRKQNSSLTNQTKNFSPRSLDAMLRLARSYSRMRLSNVVSNEDLQKSIAMFKSVYNLTYL